MLISIILFSGLAMAAYAGLFNILETRFYQPTVIESMEGNLGAVSDAMEAWHRGNIGKFAAFAEAEPVKRSLLPNQSAQDIFDRLNLAGTLMADMPGLAGIRIIDAGDTTQSPAEDSGRRRIHFSTFSQDLLKKEDLQIAYENYGKAEDEIPFALISRADSDSPRVIAEATKDRFLYCFPFRDAYSTWRGTAVFYVSTRAAAQYLVEKNLFRISDEIVLVNSEDFSVSGTVYGMPQPGRKILSEAIVTRWTRQDFTTDRIVSTDDSGWVLLSRKAGDYGYTGQVVQESLFVFPQTIRIFFLTVSFLTIFLIIFLFLNLKQDHMTVARNRIRRFQIQLLGELMEKTDDARWDEMRKNLSYRKHDINAELKKGLGKRFTKKHGKEIDELLDKSWEEIIGAIGKQETQQAALTNTDEIRRMLEQVLQNNAVNPSLTGAPAAPSGRAFPAIPAAIPPSAPKPEETEEAEAVEELEDFEEVEEVEELEDIGEAEPAEDAETVEQLEEVEEVEEVGELEDIGEAEPAEDAETVEELEEVEELEDIGAAEPAEDGPATSATAKAAEAAPPAVEEEKPAEAEAAEAPDAEPVLTIEDFPEINVYSFDELKALDDYQESEEFFEQASKDEEEIIAPIEPEEVEYLDAEWEPELLDVATDEELDRFIEEYVPDTVLVYNFDEKPGFDTGNRHEAEKESESLEAIESAESPDFSSLDANNMESEEEAAEVDYIDEFLLRQGTLAHNDIRDEPVTDFLEVVGEAEPEELLALDLFEGSEGENAILNQDGLYIVSVNPETGRKEKIDPEFKQLVDSVLL